MRTDHFATLGQPRRPWLDPEALKHAFQRLAAAHHPDVSGDTRFSAEVNAAFATLRDPASRLRHLLELEFPDAIAGNAAPVPAALAERFMEVATLKRELDAFLHQQSGATNPLAKALLAAERFAERRDLEQEIAELESERDRALEGLCAEDAEWDARTPETGLRLAALQRELAFLGKWIAQLEEGLVRLEAGA